MEYNLCDVDLVLISCSLTRLDFIWRNRIGLSESDEFLVFLLESFDIHQANVESYLKKFEHICVAQQIPRGRTCTLLATIGFEAYEALKEGFAPDLLASKTSFRH